MAWNSTVRPALADVYFNWESEQPPVPPPSIGGIVVAAATSDNGPINTPVLCTSYDRFTAKFGDSDTPLRRATFDAFKGQGVGGKGGAGAVLVYRQAASSAAAATHTLMNTAGTPAAALVLTAKYPGTRANGLRVTVQSSAITGKDELLVLDGANVVEKYDYTTTDINGLAAQINALSDWLVASVSASGTALAHVSAVALSGGLDGATITGTEWSATFDALDRQNWAVFPAYNVTDSMITASIVAWIQTRNSLGARCMAVFGGASGETFDDASTRSTTINDYDIINLGEGILHLTDQDRDVSTAEFVSRYAGARAWRGESRDDFFVRFADVELISGASLSEQADALASGVVVFSRDTNADAPVFIREAVNTYSDDSASPVDAQGNKTHPVALYRRIKNIAIQQGIELEIGDWARTSGILGDLPVDDKTRALILGRIQTAYSTREAAQVVQPGWTVAIVAGSDSDDFVEYAHGFKPRRSLRQILNTARVG